MAALFIALGFLTRLSALALVVNMLVIFLVMHAGETFAQRELQWLFLSGFAALLVAGPGRLSLDGLFFRNK